MIKKILIANRGEIACRIIKTAKKMAIETIAIFSDADKNALHVKLADHAVCIGPPPSQQSYLNRHKIITVAKEHGADAIHPGYGFLAEDGEFSALCTKNNIIFIGPNAACIKSMGNKSLAKQLMRKAKVATVPGYEGENQTEKTLQKEADAIGYPLLVKAVAGGGGKGMRLIKDSKEFLNALQEAKQEALASFGDDRVLLEKYLSPARHIEIQIFADQHGNAVYLFDRDCSIQRRHQKIIEEAPAPLLSDELRQKMGEAAIRAALAIQYSGAGTIEFLLDTQQNFYFMEMNTRLQVEHPVTEMITHQDLVEWQIKVASGERLPLLQRELCAHGHAIEARICAENPYKDFIPATGKLSLLHFPEEKEASVRIDSGVIQNDVISPYYDSMIAKLIVWGETREQAVQKMIEQLEKTYIIGVETNVTFLCMICHSEPFKKSALSTEFIKNNAPFFQNENLLPEIVVAAAIAAECRWRHQQGFILSEQSQDISSPWFIRDGWRLNATTQQSMNFCYQQKNFTYHFQLHENDIIIHDVKKSIRVEPKWLDELQLRLEFKGEIVRTAVIHHAQSIFVFYSGILYPLHLSNPNKTPIIQQIQPSQFIAPMPSTVVEINVANGQKVSEGEKIMVLEAMKMRHIISAPTAGVVKEVYFKKGDLLNEGDTLLNFEELGST